MSHRLPINNNNTNVGLNNYDHFNTKIKRGKTQTSLNPSQRMPLKNVRETVSSKSKLTMQTVNQPIPRNRINSNQMIRERNMLPPPPPPHHLVNNRNLYNGNNNGAMVEVTVKAQKNVANTQNRPVSHTSGNNNGTGETWARILKANTDEVRPFNNFDPLRTIHFLSKELQLKLIQKMPTDYSVLEMLEDMQQALTRIPPDLLSALKQQMIESKESSNYRSGTTSDSEYVRPQTSEKCVQTSKSFTLIASEKLHKHIEESSVKIEAACTQMEAVCTKLKAEKLELEALLRKERDNIDKLRDQLTTQDVVSRAKEEQLTKLVEEISNEKNTLEIEMKKLNVQIESHQTIANDDLKSLIRDLRKKKSDAEREAMVARHKLTLTGMENEKVMAQISTRDSQISEMRDEMKQLQEVVNEQLVELQNIRCTTERSSVSTLTDSNVWHHPERDRLNQRHKNDVIKDINDVVKDGEEVVVRKRSSSTCKVMVSGDTSLSSSGLKNIDYDGIRMYLNKEFDEITGDAQQPNNMINNKLLESNTTTTTTGAYDLTLNDPINMSNFIKNVKEQALSIAAAPMQQQQQRNNP